MRCYLGFREYGQFPHPCWSCSLFFIVLELIVVTGLPYRGPRSTGEKISLQHGGGNAQHRNHRLDISFMLTIDVSCLAEESSQG